jgi:hypothetical protein
MLWSWAPPIRNRSSQQLGKLRRGDGDRQLDALAHVIAKDDIEAVAAEWGISRNGVYQLARNALRRLQRALSR